MTVVYGFNNAKIAERLDRFVRDTSPQFQKEKSGGGRQGFHDLNIVSSRNGIPLGVFVAKTPGGGISAASEDGSGNLTPGTADCDFYKYNKTTGKYEPYQPDGSTTVTKEVDNISQTAVAGDTFIQVKREVLSGRLLCDFEDCT